MIRRTSRMVVVVVQAAAGLFCGFSSSQAVAATYTVAKGSHVSFDAKITASSFVAKSDALSGKVIYDPATSTLQEAHLAVKVDSLDTGMSLRNHHMRDKYLQASKYPQILLDVPKTTIAAKEGAEADIKGTFTIKGHKKTVPMHVRVDDASGGGMVITATLKLNVTDYGIPQPKFMVVKMDPVIAVTVNMNLARAK